MYTACPKCDWRPSATLVWTCTCGHQWHTFNTHGVCPACGKTWTATQCPLCGAWSDHEDWYHEADERTVEEFLADRRRHKENPPRDLDL
jgi:predicted amidophosphoribosyltransferase